MDALLRPVLLGVGPGVPDPVANDADFKIWRAYGVRAWPTLVLIDPAGYVVATASGEGKVDAFDEAKRAKGQPAAIIAKTVKGKGVSFMENNPDWHGKGPSKEQLDQALAEIGE